MEQHALLHGRERVDVFDGFRRAGKHIHVGLCQRRQREVRRCHAVMTGCGAVLNHSLELYSQGVGQ